MPTSARRLSVATLMSKYALRVRSLSNLNVCCLRTFSLHASSCHTCNEVQEGAARQTSSIDDDVF